MDTIKRKSLLYKTGVEYGDYTINHVQGCYHGCLYPCYAFLMARRFGRVKDQKDWCEPKLVGNAIELLIKEIPKLKDKIQYVHLSFTTDPFMMGFPEVSELSLQIIDLLNKNNIPCTVLTKGILPGKLAEFKNRKNEYGITLISINENFRKKIEPNAASYKERITSLKYLHDHGKRTWVSIEPYPTPNIIDQDFNKILESISFVDKIIFGRLHYNGLVNKYDGYQSFYNKLAEVVIEYCTKHGKDYHIKEKTVICNHQ